MYQNTFINITPQVLHANLEIHIGYLRYRNHVAVLVGACIALSLLFSIVAVISTRYFMKLKRRDDAIVTQLEKRILQTKTKYQTEMKTRKVFFLGIRSMSIMIFL